MRKEMKIKLLSVAVVSVFLASPTISSAGVTTIGGSAKKFDNNCKLVPVANKDVVIERFKKPAFREVVKTNSEGEFFTTVTTSGKKLFAVYLPDYVTTKTVYNNVRPCIFCARVVQLIIPNKDCSHVDYNITLY